MSTSLTLPRKNMLIGITHLADGTKLIKEAKVLKEVEEVHSYLILAGKLQKSFSLKMGLK